MIGLHNIQEHAGEYWRNAATQAYTGIIEHYLHAYDGMVCLGGKEYEEYFKEIMTTWAVLAARGTYGEGLGDKNDSEHAKYAYGREDVIKFWFSSMCLEFKYPIEWETIILIGIYDESVNFNLRLAMYKLNRIEIENDLQGCPLLKGVAALNVKYHGSVERGIYPYNL